MSNARLCAIDLGSVYISTVHFFLADCKREDRQSIRDFVFKNAEEFQRFYDSQRVAESAFFDSVLHESLPITVEAEQTIKAARKLYKKSIMPCHLFLAAGQLKDTLFHSVLEPKEGLHERLVSYYTQRGIVLNTEIGNKNFWQRVTFTLKFR